MLRKIVKLANISAPLEFTVAEQLVNEEAKLLKGKQDSALNLYLVLVCVGWLGPRLQLVITGPQRGKMSAL